MITTGMSRSFCHRRGTATVELAMVAPILIVFLFGTIELGYLISTTGQLWNLAREGARAAAVGLTPVQVEARLQESMGGLDPSSLTVTQTYRPDESYPTGTWPLLAEHGVTNTAPYGALIRVEVSYQHKLLLPGLFGWFLATGSTPRGEAVKLLRTSVTTRRE